MRMADVLDMTLDEIYAILSEPPDYRNNNLTHAKVTTHRAVLHTCMKLGLDRGRGALIREKVISNLTREMQGADPLDMPITEER